MPKRKFKGYVLKDGTEMPYYGRNGWVEERRNAWPYKSHEEVRTIKEGLLKAYYDERCHMWSDLEERRNLRIVRVYTREKEVSTFLSHLRTIEQEASCANDAVKDVALEVIAKLEDEYCQRPRPFADIVRDLRKEITG